MPAERLTDAAIKNATPPADKPQVDLWDATVRGFSLRVTSQGVKTFSYVYRNDVGQQRRVKIGRYPAMSLENARKVAKVLSAEVAKGIDPAAKRKREKVDTVNGLIDTFLNKHAVNNRRGDETGRLLKKHVAPVLGSRDFTTIKRAEIIKIIDGLAEPSGKKGGKPSLARNVLAAVRKMFNWAMSKDLLEFSPCAGVKCDAPPAKRNRRLDDAELKAVWAGLEGLGWPFRPIVRLLILSGQRREQIAGLRWSWVDFGRREIVFPETVMKNKREHTLPMSDALERELRALPRFEDDDRVFPSRVRKSVACASGFTKAKARLDELSGVSGWRLHDLRRTAKSGMSRLRVPGRVSEMVLSHVITGVEGVYDQHGYIDEMREALSAWAAYVETLTKAEQSEAEGERLAA